MAVFIAAAPIGSQAAEQTIFYHLDALGSPVVATDEGGNVLWREEYRPYGDKIQNDPASTISSRAFTGHPHDNTTGLTYAGARHYDPIVGRFMGVDPAAFDENDPTTFNRYSYVGNNPYKYVDPDGMRRIATEIGGGGARGSGTIPGGVGGGGVGNVQPSPASAATGRLIPNSTSSPVAKEVVHKNSLEYVGETHLYRIKSLDGSTYKIGESAQGTRVRDGASIRAEQQARRLTKETGDTHTTEIRKTFPDKASVRDYETRVIERFRRMYGNDTLPGNKTNR